MICFNNVCIIFDCHPSICYLITCLASVVQIALLLISMMMLLTKNETYPIESILPAAATLLPKHIKIENIFDEYYRIILDRIYTSTYL